MVYWVGQRTIVLVAADDSVPAQLITLILLTNRCYTKIAKEKIILVHLYLILCKFFSKLVDKFRRYSKLKQTQ